MQKVIELKERSSTIIERRKKRKNRRFIIMLTLLGIVLLVLIYFQSPLSHISKIQVLNNELENKEYYIKHSGLSEGESLWGFTTNETMKKLENMDIVKEASVKRVGFNKVQLKVVENKKVAILKNGSSYNYILENGKVLSNRIKPQVYDLPIVLKLNDEEQRQQLMQQLMKLKPDLLAMISQIEAAPTKSNPNLVSLFMSEGFEVKVAIDHLATKLQYYPSIISQLKNEEKGMINLEIGSYYNSFKREYK